MEDIMLDIETLSTHQSEALILSIGAMRFSSQTFGDQVLLTPDITEQLLMGRRVDRDTQLWWKSQKKEAQEHWVNPVRVLPVRETLVLLADFIASEPTKRLWANGIVFDIGNLDNLYRSLSFNVPWAYNAPRDARTFYDHPVIKELPVEENEILHTPLADCRIQIRRLWERGWGAVS